MYSITSDMSRGIVSQKPFTRKKRRQSIRKSLNRSGVSIPEFKISKKLKSILSWWLFFILFVIWGILILIKSLFFKPEHTISQIKFSDSTLATYQDIELFNFISNSVKWKNYYMLLSNKDKLLSDIQKNFPFVWAIDLQLEQQQEKINVEQDSIAIWIRFPSSENLQSWTLTGAEWDNNIPNEMEWENTQDSNEANDIQNTDEWNNNTKFMQTQIVTHKFPLKSSQKSPDNGWTLWIQLSYIQPRVLVKLNDKKFAVRNENLFVELQEWMLLSTEKIDPKWDDTIGNLKEMFTIETPWYVSGTNSLSWFFFEVSLDNVLKIASLAKEEFWNNMKRFVYLAWSTRFAIFTSDDKTLYFNFPSWWNIEDQRSAQIFKYNTLKEIYPNFNKIEKLDLWALENNKTIITNY